MIIKIEDAPNIKNVKIDIQFDEEGNISQTIESNRTTEPLPQAVNKTTEISDIKLDLEEDFDINTDVIEKPVIPDVKKEVKVSDEMTNAEF